MLNLYHEIDLAMDEYGIYNHSMLVLIDGEDSIYLMCGDKEDKHSYGVNISSDGSIKYFIDGNHHRRTKFHCQMLDKYYESIKYIGEQVREAEEIA